MYYKLTNKSGELIGMFFSEQSAKIRADLDGLVDSTIEKHTPSATKLF